MPSATDESASALDDFLLGRPVSKPQVIERLLGARVDAPAAAPFYRALEAVGPRAADEAFVALRLVVAGREPDDASVARLRALARVVRAHATGDGAGLRAVRERERAQLADLAPTADAATYAAAARAAYDRALRT